MLYTTFKTKAVYLLLLCLLLQSAELLAVAELSGAREGSGTNDSVALAAPIGMGR
jgi:hypothetical protein